MTPGAMAKEHWRIAGREALGKRGTLSGGVEAKKTGTEMSPFSQTRGRLKKDAGRRECALFPIYP